MLLGLVAVYRYLLSPFLPQACRFAPSCSAYAAEALQRHGALTGGWLALRRVIRCHPWGGTGYDPVPAYPRSGLRAQRHPSTPDAPEPIGPPA